MSTRCCHNWIVGNAAVAVTRRKEPARRRTGEHAPRLGGRSARVVTSVLAATLDEVAAVGYRALRVEDVAARASVNKTSIYRRWPTKAALVEAALFWHAAPSVDPPDTGTIEGDALEALRRVVARRSSTLGRALFRVALVERDDPELRALSKRVGAELRAQLEKMVRRARERGELAASVRPALVVDALLGPVSGRLQRDEDVDARYLRELVALVLDGARAR